MEVSHNQGASRFEIPFEGQPAVAEYWRENGTITFTHTEVPVEHRGQGVAERLAEAAFGYARAEGLKVVARCPFMASWLRRHPEYHDLKGD